MPPKSKRRKAASLRRDDRISELPDLIIGEILSLLPTEQAVATSIMSKRWRYHWTSVRNLDFCCFDEREEATFVEFVDRVLSNCTTHDLHKFHLSTYYNCHSHVDRWINEAVIRNVQRLKLNVTKLPGSVFTCGSLTSLDCEQKLLNIPASFYLPKLKVLHVSFNRESTSIGQKLISSCPVLEDLFLKVVDIQLTFVISPPILKKLILSCYDAIETERKIVIDAPQLQFLHIESNCFIEKGSKLVIDAPQLEFLNIESSGPVPSYLIKSVASEVEATIVFGDCNRDVEDKDVRSILELLTQLSGVKSLALDTSYLAGPRNADPSIIPIFNKMTLLALVMGPFYDLEIISDLLQASPSFQVFIVKMVDSYVAVEEPPLFEFQWIEPQHVPKCLSSCLQVIELHCNFQEEIKQELEMMKYLLSHGEVLQKLVFCIPEVYESEEVYKKLLTFPRASRHCAVQVL